METPSPSQSTSEIPKGVTSIRRYFSAGLPRMAGYGLFALFALDLLQLAASYQPFMARMDAHISMQILERSGVLIVAYVLVFFETDRNPSRFSRAAMKALSWMALISVLGYLALGCSSVISATRIYRENEQANQIEWRTRKELIRRVDTSLPTLRPQQASIILGEFLPSSKSKIASMSPDEVLKTLKNELPELEKQADDRFSRIHRSHLRDQISFGAKYLAAGLLMAVIMFLIFENTREARRRIVFENRSGPQLRVEGYVADKAYRTWVAMESLGDLLLPDLTHFSWYRRLKRKFKRRDK